MCATPNGTHAEAGAQGKERGDAAGQGRKRPGLRKRQEVLVQAPTSASDSGFSSRAAAAPLGPGTQPVTLAIGSER